MFGKYQVVKHLAVGGMAEVCLAKLSGPQGFSKLVVVKQVLPALAQDPRFISMFLDEGRLAARLQHPNIAQTFELGEAGGRYFMAMEYVAGETLMSVLKRVKEVGLSVPLSCALRITLQLLEALEYAHQLKADDGTELKLVHRDVTPSNVMVTYHGGLKLLDFGIAKASTHSQNTEAGRLKGKGGYMSPEACRGEALDGRSDLYAVGSILYHLVTGSRPFEKLIASGNLLKVVDATVEGSYPHPRELKASLPEELEAIILKAMALAPADRYASAAAMHEALETLAGATGVLTGPRELTDFMRRLFPERVELARSAEMSGDAASAVELSSQSHRESLSASRVASGFALPSAEPQVATPAAEPARVTRSTVTGQRVRTVPIASEPGALLTGSRLTPESNPAVDPDRSPGEASASAVAPQPLHSDELSSLADEANAADQVASPGVAIAPSEQPSAPSTSSRLAALKSARATGGRGLLAPPSGVAKVARANAPEPATEHEAAIAPAPTPAPVKPRRSSPPSAPKASSAAAAGSTGEERMTMPMWGDRPKPDAPTQASKALESEAPPVASPTAVEEASSEPTVKRSSGSFTSQAAKPGAATELLPTTTAAAASAGVSHEEQRLGAQRDERTHVMPSAPRPMGRALPPTVSHRMPEPVSEHEVTALHAPHVEDEPRTVIDRRPHLDPPTSPTHTDPEADAEADARGDAHTVLSMPRPRSSSDVPTRSAAAAAPAPTEASSVLQARDEVAAPATRVRPLQQPVAMLPPVEARGLRVRPGHVLIGVAAVCLLMMGLLLGWLSRTQKPPSPAAEARPVPAVVEVAPAPSPTPVEVPVVAPPAQPELVPVPAPDVPAPGRPVAKKGVLKLNASLKMKVSERGKVLGFTPLKVEMMAGDHQLLLESSHPKVRRAIRVRVKPRAETVHFEKVK